MSEQDKKSAEEPVYRCPTCDSVVTAVTQRCLMCGTVQPERPLSMPQPAAKPELLESLPEAEAEPAEIIELASKLEPEETLESVETVETVEPVQEQPAQATAPIFVHIEDPYYAKDAPRTVAGSSLPKQPNPPRRLKGSVLIYGITAVAIILIILLGILTVQSPGTAATPALAEIVYTPAAGFTPSTTPSPTGTALPSETPTITPTPLPTNTLEPPRQHTISSGDTLFGLAQRYRISLDSILETNEMTQESSIIVGQNLLIPWPTPTPPLEPIGIEYNGELVIADPTDCRRYEIVSGDSLNAIAARADLDYDLFLRVNRLTSESVIQPGDSVCIPAIVYGATLPPTAGPSPTPSLTPPPPGPSLLYPVQEAVIEPPDGLITLQWVALKDLAEDEWYMVEVTDMAVVDSTRWRGFTRDNAFQVPSRWRPDVVELHQMRWRVSLVKVTGFREDGLPIFTYGGQNSADALFTWEGAIPTPTPTATPTITATAPPAPTAEG